MSSPALRHRLRVIFGVSVALASGFALNPAHTSAANSLALSATYRVTAKLNYGAGTINVDTAATVTNNTASTVGELSFNVAAMRTGGAKIGAVTAAGVTIVPRLSDQTLTMTLPAPLGVGARTTVSISYRATLRTDDVDKDWQLAKLRGIVTCYRWIPWLSRPVAFDRPNFGTPYVTGISPLVNVAITADRTLTFGTTGTQTGKSGLTYSFQATNVRDFNFAASPNYSVLTGWAGSVKVCVLYVGLPSAKLLNKAILAINTYSDWLAAYPYSQFTVAESGGGKSMESPGLVYIDHAATSTNVPYLVAHETAHQWFYGIVGSDQAREPFADEAATDFLARQLLGNRRKSNCARDDLDRTVYDYGSACYYEVIYIQGGNNLNAFREAHGDLAFWAGLRNYVERYRFAMGGTSRLWAELDAAASYTGGHFSRFPSRI